MRFPFMTASSGDGTATEDFVNIFDLRWALVIMPSYGLGSHPGTSPRLHRPRRDRGGDHGYQGVHDDMTTRAHPTLQVSELDESNAVTHS